MNENHDELKILEGKLENMFENENDVNEGELGKLESEYNKICNRILENVT